ncbi:methyltransferase domain-containing protein [Streptomyces marincola]|uniref:methyltransferase domain-containing protein n=1 Tax=Streptomyces marincola TaxID=2878388 RepID=UPI0021005BAC|nr:methyltransferase domain-containing protein [Streptomyces marincola]
MTFTPPAGWEEAFAALPRAAFLPRVMWPHDQVTDTFATIDRTSDPEGWRAAADADVPIVTQWDDGRHTGPMPGRDATSSSSKPSLVAAMLATLDAEPGMRVLEIGTGTGWTAALLAHRLGAGHVTSVEIDPRVARAAGSALRRAGLHTRLVVGDGALGAPGHAPFDRIVVTCGMRRVPSAWLRQLRPGGRLLMPWGTPFVLHRDGLVSLTSRPDGTAAGRFADLVSFMRMRSQRDRLPSYPRDLPLHDHESAVWPPGGWAPFPFLAGLRLTDAAYAEQRHEDGRTVWLYDLAGAGWTAAVRRDGVAPGVVVRRAGRRPLWEEYTAAHSWWREAGEPGIERFGLTVRPDGSATPWLDAEEQTVGPLPSMSRAADRG